MQNACTFLVQADIATSTVTEYNTSKEMKDRTSYLTIQGEVNVC
jgi:hypothetical protein